MDAMRKEAIRKKKIEFAKVRRTNELYLAEDESRLQVTHKRLFEQGTRKLKDINQSQFEDDYQVTPQRQRRNVGDRLSFAEIRGFQHSPLRSNVYK